MDVDGVLTDGLIHLDDHGVESKVFSTRDGLALMLVRHYGMATGVISGRRSPGTEQRCRDLQMDEIHLGCPHKLVALEEILQRTGIAPETIAFIGDDIIDLPIVSRVGLSAAPSDAHEEVLRRVDIVLDYPGGRGAVRQFLDLWLMVTGHWETSIEDILHGHF
jgi:3-deoxy-D-manno-octulosonate 8-phosphate phosphatase (KDO 8-P phosphatase)